MKWRLVARTTENDAGFLRGGNRHCPQKRREYRQCAASLDPSNCMHGDLPLLVVLAGNKLQLARSVGRAPTGCKLHIAARVVIPPLRVV